MRKVNLPSLPIGPKTVLIAGIILAIVAPTLFSLPAIFKIVNFTSTGQIGDTIGGITAPFINITAAILIYYSFREQLRANEIQIKALKAGRKDIQQERKIEFLLKLIDSLDQRIMTFEFTIIETSRMGKERILYKGIDGIQGFCNTVYNSDKYANGLNIMNEESSLTLSAFSELFHIVGILSFISHKISTASITKDNKKDLMERLNLTYVTALQANLNTFFEKFQNMDIQNSKIRDMEDHIKSFISIKEKI